MKIKQISIFLENTTGRLANVTKILKESGVNLRAIMIADTADFGILRVIVDNPDKALTALKTANFTTKTTEVLAVPVNDKVGAMHDMLKLFEENSINIEYIYASLERAGDTAIIIFKVENPKAGLEVLEANGLTGKVSF
ncbi:MAG: amino acid-binding protein [Treponema sp. CETP13]|nr:MAG: amino acid-binding protein [Treponema sp. CETP13]